MGSWEDIRREARETWNKSWAEIKKNLIAILPEDWKVISRDKNLFMHRDLEIKHKSWKHGSVSISPTSVAGVHGFTREEGIPERIHVRAAYALGLDGSDMSRVYSIHGDKLKPKSPDKVLSFLESMVDLVAQKRENAKLAHERARERELARAEARRALEEFGAEEDRQYMLSDHRNYKAVIDGMDFKLTITEDGMVEMKAEADAETVVWFLEQQQERSET